jgi:hypothetical protein
MRKILAWPLAWALFWAGDIASRAFLRHDATAFMYPVYNRLMAASCDVQDWADLSGPWSKTNA